MSKYTAEQLEKRFRRVGIARKRNKKFSNDSTYWEGGNCNWGGSHNLREDCQTLANNLNKIDSLKNIKKELLETTNQEEFENKKKNFLRKIEEIEASGLQIKTSKASSMFGICIIWADEASNNDVERIVNEVQKEIDGIKKTLGKETYAWTEEIKQLDLEIGKIETEIQKQKKEALDEKDPIRRGKIMEAIEENSKVLEEKYRKKQELSKRFNFNPSKKVKRMLDTIKNVLDKKEKKTNKHKEPKANKNPDDSNSESSDVEDSNNESDNESEDDEQSAVTIKNKQSWWEKNKQLIFFGSLFLSVAIYIYFQEDEKFPTLNE
ncbi:MAG: Xanthine phosphoribosyltransferase [Mycoplasmataceae bacterium]|nr:MAG: Xanthine phosphoribosyltransferase [Mycoplasmataceae bacterium]